MDSTSQSSEIVPAALLEEPTLDARPERRPGHDEVALIARSGAPADDRWMDEALCKGQVETFFGQEGERPERRVKRLRLAAMLCDACSVSAPCREQGRRMNAHGFWGGETDEERARAGFVPTSPSRRSVLAARDEFRNEAECDDRD